MRVLLYHDIVAADATESVGFTGPAAAVYKLDPALFAAHLDAIESEGIAVGLVRQGSPMPEVALTFDDGGESALAAAAELERHGWRGHFFITTGRLGSPGFLNGDQVRDLLGRGHVVGSHSQTHPTYFGRLPDQELEHEWRVSRQIIGEIAGIEPDSASVPGGFLTRRVIEVAGRVGYRLLFTSEPSVRVARYGPVTTIGRFTLRSGDSAELAVSLARGDLAPRARMWTAWKVKQAAKRVSPRAFELARDVTHRSHR